MNRILLRQMYRTRMNTANSILRKIQPGQDAKNLAADLAKEIWGALDAAYESQIQYNEHLGGHIFQVGGAPAPRPNFALANLNVPVPLSKSQAIHTVACEKYPKLQVAFDLILKSSS